MFDLTSLDYVYIIVLLASTVWATIRGGVYETIATLSWVAAAIAARFASPWLDAQKQKTRSLKTRRPQTRSSTLMRILQPPLIALLRHSKVPLKNQNQAKLNQI